VLSALFSEHYYSSSYVLYYRVVNEPESWVNLKGVNRRGANFAGLFAKSGELNALVPGIIFVDF
jgi:hypothetical protein